MHPPAAPAPGSRALDLWLDRKSEPGQMMQKEWKTARVKGSFSLSDAGCIASPGTRPNAAPWPSLPEPVCAASPASPLNLPGAGRSQQGRAVSSQLPALQHLTLPNGTQNTEKNPLGTSKKDPVAMKAVKVSWSPRQSHTLFWREWAIREVKVWV